MKEIDKKTLKTHLFVCCRERDGKPACGSKNATILVKNLKAWIKENNLKDAIKCSSSSCLGHCEDGITACLYPQKQWFTNISLKDEEALKEILLNIEKS